MIALNCSKEKEKSNSKGLEQNNECCDKILVRADPIQDSIVKLLYICFSKGGDEKKVLFRDFALEISNNNSKITATTKLYIDTIINGKQPLVLMKDFVDGIVNEKYSQKAFSQKLYKIQCGTKYVKDENRTSILSVYLYENGQEKCYACSEKELKEHPEFTYFYNSLNDKNIYSYKLDELIMKKDFIVDSLKNK